MKPAPPRPASLSPLSTMGTTSVERVAEAGAGGRHWFQLYVWTDRDRSMQLVDRAAKAGYTHGAYPALRTPRRSARSKLTGLLEV
jgi:isopentenyl diphosphate isomerase/L-lactate dehydrogenase-like FMN-dependent dehydrogenase